MGGGRDRAKKEKLMDQDSNMAIARGRTEEDIKGDKWRLDKLLAVKIHLY